MRKQNAKKINSLVGEAVVTRYKCTEGCLDHQVNHKAHEEPELRFVKCISRTTADISSEISEKHRTPKILS